MFLDLCLSIWSFLGQTPLPAATAAATAPEAPAAPAVFQLGIGQHILMAVYLMVCLSLIAVVMQQEQKSGGLQGMLGAGAAPMEHKYQGKKSFEENLRIISNYLAVAFIGLSIAVSYVMQMPH